MSHAWRQLQKAVHTLCGDEQIEQRLVVCLSIHLACLRCRDLPGEVHDLFNIVQCNVPAYPKGSAKQIRQCVLALTRYQRATIARIIVTLFDATARYQPAGQVSDASQDDAGLVRHDPVESVP